ncbi:MAG: hypothetical protein IPJ34_38895 [Myxococcales bacterium]|nr:hypothetical protein [Myxococcales bacterium]
MRLLPLLPMLFIGGCFAPHEGPRQYPTWRADGQKQPFGACADATVVPRASGKEGLGLTLRLEGRGAPCIVAVTAIEFRVGDQVFPAQKLPPAMTLKAGDEVFSWVPIRFDGDAVWEDLDKRKGVLVVRDQAGATASFPLVLAMEDRSKCE